MSRYYDSPSNEQQPLLWFNGYGIYAAHFIVLVYVVSMVVTAACMSLQAAFWFTWLPYGNEEVLRGQMWRVLSFGLVNPPSIGFAIDMVMIVWFGREVEKFFGRRTFLVFFAGIYFLTPLVFTAIGIWRPMYLAGEIGALAIFVGFATVYPETPVFFNILAKWAALILVGIYALIHLASRDLGSLISLACTTGFAHAFVRFHQGRWTLPRPRLPRRKPQLRVLDGGKAAPLRENLVVDNTVAEMDTLLEKIARSGLNSLTAKERVRLQQSREEMLRRKGTAPR